MTLKEIAKQRECSISTIQRLFKTYLDNPPIPKFKANDNCHLLVDGTYISNFCIINYFDSDLKHLQYYEIVKDENYQDFKVELKLLKDAGLNIVSITSDGDRGLIMAVREVLPGIKHQRCLIHVQRMSLLYLTRYPKTNAGKDLRSIILTLHEIFNFEDKNNWIKNFKEWEFKYREFLSERSSDIYESKLYRHYDVRRVRTLINNTLPNLFHYLSDPKIQKSTNGLECRFSYLKNNLRIHRGLSNQHRRSFVLWYNWFKYND